jgi:hypothetical protein
MEKLNLNTQIHEETIKVVKAMERLSVLWQTPELVKSKYPELWKMLLDIEAGE